MPAPFSIRESLRRGWRLTERNSALLFKVLLTIAALQFAGGLSNALIGGKQAGGLFLSAVIAAAGIVFSTGLASIALKLAKGETAVYADIIPPLGIIIRFFFTGILAGIAAALPVLLALAFMINQIASAMGYAQFRAAITSVPPGMAGDAAQELLTHLSGASILVGLIGATIGAYIALRYLMARFAALDGAGIMESLHRSASMTRGAKGRLLFFGAAVLLLNVLGMLVFLVGLLITIPLSLLAFADMYLKLKSRAPCA